MNFHFGMEATAEEVTEEFVKSSVGSRGLEAEWRSGQLHMVRQGVIRTKAVKDIMDKAVVTELDLSKKKDEEEAIKKAAAKKTAKKDEAAGDEPERSPPRRPLRRRLRRRTRTSRPRPTTQNSP
ncbi:MAG: hypothetical protein ACLT98_13250 [Eggerthellaceae bacterium]